MKLRYDISYRLDTIDSDEYYSEEFSTLRKAKQEASKLLKKYGEDRLVTLDIKGWLYDCFETPTLEYQTNYDPDIKGWRE